MRKISLMLGLALVLSLFIIHNARAENISGTSVEWLTCSSEIVAVGTLKQTGKEKGVYSVSYESYNLSVTEIIRGDKRQREIPFVIRTLTENTAVKDMADRGNEVIVFLKKADKNYYNNEKFMHEKLVPANKQFPFSVINLNDPDKYVLDTKFNVLTEKNEIIETSKKALAQLKKYLKENPSVKPESLRIRTPEGSQATGVLYAGSATYLIVPKFMFPDRKDESLLKEKIP